MFLHGSNRPPVYSTCLPYGFLVSRLRPSGNRRFVTYYFPVWYRCGTPAYAGSTESGYRCLRWSLRNLACIRDAFFQNREIFLLFPPIPIKAKWLVIGYGAFELFNGVTSTMSGVAHFAHLGGIDRGFHPYPLLENAQPTCTKRLCIRSLSLNR